MREKRRKIKVDEKKWDGAHQVFSKMEKMNKTKLLTYNYSFILIFRKK